MNSFLQLLYSIPLFRYLTLSAEENAVNPVELEGKVLNDNLFYQLQKLFAYLEKSERHEYNP